MVLPEAHLQRSPPHPRSSIRPSQDLPHAPRGREGDRNAELLYCPWIGQKALGEEDRAEVHFEAAVAVDEAKRVNCLQAAFFDRHD